MVVARLLLACALVTGLLGVASAAETRELTIYPAELSLSGPEATQRLLVERTGGETNIGPVTEGTTWNTSNAEVVIVEEGIAKPIGNGDATLTATTPEGMTATVPVTVSNIGEPHTWGFTQHVLPVLSKNGCNMGACHGALAGKGELKLSLRGYDPKRDHYVLTKEARGRRIEMADPGRSLLLAKPSGAIPHKGGFRFEVGSHDYRVLAEWISAGAPGPEDDDPTLVELKMLPERMRLEMGTEQPLIVQATYSDGTVEDVTHWAKFTSADETVAKVNDKGLVTIIGHGEGAISAWFSSQLVISRVTSPYPNEVPEAIFAKSPRHNFIDEQVIAKLRDLNIPPSPQATDAEFVRRVYLDTLGALPTPEETQRFLSSKEPDRRAKLIDELLERPEFVDYWTYKWSDVLMLNGTLLRPPQVKAYYEWIRGEVEQNTPWDEFVQKIVTAKGNSLTNGATNFYALHQTPEDMTENVSQAFMGLSIACAKCHNHPLEKWTNNQYYAMANLFSRVRAKGWGGDSRNGDGNRTIYVVQTGELAQPLTGRPQPPTPLDAEPLAFDDPIDRREYLAQWLTSPENPYFARSITNRVWANFFGVGLIEQVDDLRVSNPASNEELLTTAADYLVENDFDLKALMRAILNSAAYQRSSKPLEANKAEQRFYSRYYPRRLMAEVLLDAIVSVTEVPTKFDTIVFPGADTRKTDVYGPGTKAIQLHDSAVKSYFLQTFGRNQRRITCECERSDEPSMVQVLHLSNGDTLNQKLAAKDGRVAKLLEEDITDTERIERAYLLCLSRSPSDQERTRLLTMLENAPEGERQIVFEDLFWALMTSREFLFNH